MRSQHTFGGMQSRYKPVGWRGESQRHYLAAKYGRTYKVEKSDFVRYGGETYFRSSDGKLINVMNARDIQEQDDSAYEEARIMSSLGIFPWESAPIVESAFTRPLPVYSAKKMKALPVYSVKKMREGNDGLDTIPSSGVNAR